MTQIQAKVCMLGAFAVGKTSLVARFVTNVFSEKYQTTVGVKVDTKELEVDGTQVKLVVWDIAGEAEISGTTRIYLRGATGFLVVADGTRRHTVDTAQNILAEVDRSAAPQSRLLLLNKADLHDRWEVDEEALQAGDYGVHPTSARSGAGVEEAFAALARGIVAARTQR